LYYGSYLALKLIFDLRNYMTKKKIWYNRPAHESHMSSTILERTLAFRAGLLLLCLDSPTHHTRWMMWGARNIFSLYSHPIANHNTLAMYQPSTCLFTYLVATKCILKLTYLSSHLYIAYLVTYATYPLTCRWLTKYCEVDVRRFPG